jgi:transcriptional regulator
MYIPAAFRESNIATLHAFIKQFSFATLVTPGDETAVTHLPLILDPEKGKLGTLYGHFARPNSHWQLDHKTRNSTAIFHGPHAYISPTWYRDPAPAVPTWNYAVVHAIGKLTLIEDLQRASNLLHQIALTFEQPPAVPRHNLPSPEIHERLTRSIVAFEMPIDDLIGKFKLGQNRSPVDQQSTIEGLEATGDPDSKAMAAFTKARLR